jgi:hypothetical protein
VPLDWKPFWYEPQGFPDILELYIHDYQDDFYWEMFANPSPGETYQDHLRRVAECVAEEDLVWSVASHDHGCATQEGFWKKGTWISEFVRYAKGLGIRFLSGSIVLPGTARQVTIRPPRPCRQVARGQVGTTFAGDALPRRRQSLHAALAPCREGSATARPSTDPARRAQEHVPHLGA